MKIVAWAGAQALLSAIFALPVPALAANVGPLAAGPMAGVRAAQAQGTDPVLLIAGAGAAVALVSLLAINNGGNAVASVTIGTTPTGDGTGTGSSGTNTGGTNTGNQGDNNGGSDGGSSGVVIHAPTDDIEFPIIVATTTTTAATATATGTH